MDRGAWQAILHGVPHSLSKVTEHACMKLRADPIAKELRISTDQAGGLEQEKQKSINLSLRTRLKRMQQNTQEG